jgi:hypothetical protein
MTNRVAALTRKITSLSDAEQEQFLGWLIDAEESPAREVFWDFFNLALKHKAEHVALATDVLEALRQHFDRARNKERDAEIVRLKDLEKKSWGWVLRIIKERWPLTERKTPITINAIRAAYRQCKANQEGM